jgi:hypothetical protein
MLSAILERMSDEKSLDESDEFPFRIKVGPIIVWPGGEGDELRAIIGELQELNSQLGLRCALAVRQDRDFSEFVPEAREEQRKIYEECGDSEYLVYDGTAFDVFTIVMPEPPDDKRMSELTDLNRETDRADGSRHIPERTPPVRAHRRRTHTHSSAFVERGRGSQPIRPGI